MFAAQSSTLTAQLDAQATAMTALTDRLNRIEQSQQTRPDPVTVNPNPPRRSRPPILDYDRRNPPRLDVEFPPNHSYRCASRPDGELCVGTGVAALRTTSTGKAAAVRTTRCTTARAAVCTVTRATARSDSDFSHGR